MYNFEGDEEEVRIICHIQHPDREDEKERITKAGGKVVWYGTFRVNGQIAVSRYLFPYFFRIRRN